MHPELLFSLAADHRRDLDGAMRRRRDAVGGARSATLSAAPVPPPGSRALRTSRAPARLRPGLRISWTGTTLAAANGRGRSRSWVIVISATRPL